MERFHYGYIFVSALAAYNCFDLPSALNTFVRFLTKT